ncbi:hypothetical protein C0993_002559 [Termitomyces sp. T159_Od127]|nr:hypothetical protein C0993_002559 [Termitomyces sp. T159_Od127]
MSEPRKMPKIESASKLAGALKLICHVAGLLLLYKGAGVLHPTATGVDAQEAMTERDRERRGGTRKEIDEAGMKMQGIVNERDAVNDEDRVQNTTTIDGLLHMKIRVKLPGGSKKICIPIEIVEVDRFMLVVLRVAVTLWKVEDYNGKAKSLIYGHHRQKLLPVTCTSPKRSKSSKKSKRARSSSTESSSSSEEERRRRERKDRKRSRRDREKERESERRRYRSRSRSRSRRKSYDDESEDDRRRRRERDRGYRARDRSRSRARTKSPELTRRSPSRHLREDGEEWVVKEPMAPPPVPVRSESKEVAVAASHMPAPEEDDSADELGPQPLPKVVPPRRVDERSYGGALLRGEGSAMAAFLKEGTEARIPRRGEIGLTSGEIAKYEEAGYVMSGSRHRRMNAVRMRKENQVISAEEKRGILKLQREGRERREAILREEFNELVQDRLKGAAIREPKTT